MIVRHVPCQAKPSQASAKDKVWVYRTEVENDQERPIRVVWFEFYFKNEECHGGDWYGTNVRNRPLRNQDFIDWYGDEGGLVDGWLEPGAVAVCDPNWSLAFAEKITPVKWSFLAVDAEGNDYFAEAIVSQEAATLYDPEAE